METKNVMIVGVGGQGSLLASKLLGKLLLTKGYDIKVYDLRGNLEFQEKITFDYTNIYAAEKEIIISGGDHCLIYRTNGSVKFNGRFAGNIISVVPNGNNLEYVVVYDDATEIIKLKTDATEDIVQEEE